MSAKSNIEWTGASWNPMRGCNRVGKDCDNCYMMTDAHRFEGVPGHPFELGAVFRLVPENLPLPLKWTKPNRIFVNSMSDFFHPKAPVDYLRDCCRVMVEAPWHAYQVLTKRSERMRELLNGELRFAAQADHIWWGVSAGLREGLPRIEDLRESPAKNRFLSLEPLLEDLGEINLEGISWVITGGESGPRAREVRLAWVTSIRDQCQAAGVPLFFKQWGGRRKWLTGHILDGRTYRDFPTEIRGPVKNKAERMAVIGEMEAKYGLTDTAKSLIGRKANRTNHKTK